jgi:hypothetical protein
MTQELAQDLMIKLEKKYQPNLTLNALRKHSLYPTFGKRPSLSEELIRQIIKEERVKTLDDLIRRRLSFIESKEELSKTQEFMLLTSCGLN